ncbi:hypothetical protein CYMTET_8573 [Cymbomonas tetramitiformis]|uniref:Uncharacterized protein n=1 Tax=Cymbomonas tetramitiformis TaxID=36881 RepID=A0AAE0LGD4_9CHLO|nr:hypothetical protein CYMTET_8573 [Cymbomonas tetramitiformis]
MGPGLECIIAALVLQCVGFLIMLGCDYDALLNTVGKFGISSLEKNRLVYGVSVIVATAAIALSVVGVFINFEDVDTLKATSLATSKVTKAVSINTVTQAVSPVPAFDVYFGTSSMVYSVENAEETVSWDDFICPDPDKDVCPPYYECKDALPKIPPVGYCGVGFGALLMMAMLVRLSSKDGDFVKLASLTLTAVAIALEGQVLVMFLGGCYNDLSKAGKFSILHVEEAGPPTIISGDVSFDFGPGFFCLLGGVVLQFFAFLVNMLTPANTCEYNHISVQLEVSEDKDISVKFDSVP